MIGAARSVFVTLLTIGAAAALVVLCCGAVAGCALGAKSSSRDESHSAVEEAKSEETDRHEVKTREAGPVVRTTVVPRVVSIDGHDRVVYARSREKREPVRTAATVDTAARATTATDTKTEVVKTEAHSWHAGPPWWAGIAALAGVALAAPALWNFLKARIGL